MGRSGTSALARVLSLCGGSLPGQLMPANEGNPAGYWEPLEAFHLNEDFLFRHGSSWYDPTLRLQGEVTLEDGDAETYVQKIRAFLDACPSTQPLILKEPRIAALSPFWFEACRRAGFALRIVIAVRDPEEVAASLATRDRASLELSHALWLKYNLLAERHSRHLPRVFVEYAKLLSDWRTEIDRISEGLAIALVNRDEGAIDAFLNPELRRERRSGPPRESFGQPWVGRVFAAFSSASRGATLDLQMMDETFDAYCACERTFRVASTEFRSRVGGDPWASDFATCLAQAQAHCAVDISSHLGNPVALDGATFDAIQAEFARQLDQVSEVLRRAAALEEAHARAENENARLESEMARSKAEDSALIAGLQERIDLYERSRSWRLTAPLRALRQFGRASNPQ
ncbi:MAG: hypothetical protein ND807_16115 [Vicinamibacterales bacterium]|nr:hypothetical protein [Vicinamibacterales bacterium]